MSRYDASKLKTLKYLDLSKNKWRSVEVRKTDKTLSVYRCLLQAAVGRCARHADVSFIHINLKRICLCSGFLSYLENLGGFRKKA